MHPNKVTIAFEIVHLACGVELGLIEKEKLSTLLETRKDEINWSAVQQLAEIHFVPVLLNQYFSKATTSLDKPDFVAFKTALNEVARQKTIANLFVLNELLQLLAHLKTENMLVVPYKGIFLSQFYYNDPCLRQLTDIDLFIYRKDLDNLIKVMHQKGYASELTFSKYAEKIYYKFGCEYNFVKYNSKNEGILIEAHYKSNAKSWDIDLFMEQLEARVEDFTLNGQSLKGFDKEATLVICLTNHAYNDAWMQLKYINDFALILSKLDENSDWNWIIETCKTLGIYKGLLVGLRLVSLFYAVKIPNFLQNAIHSNEITQLSAERQLAIFQYKGRSFSTQIKKVIFTFHTKENILSKLKFCFFYLFSPTKMEVIHLTLPNFLFPLYALYRPFRMILSYIRI